MPLDSRTWVDYSEAFAFFGNSLLAPMSQTDSIGLDPDFWRTFPDFGSTDVARALADCRGYAEYSQALIAEGGDAVQRASVEYTMLFVGPPKPAAPPWETFYRSGAESGFGQATFEMRELLREAGLEVSNANNQYADHVGIELLYLSVLCGRAAADETCADAPVSFIEERLLLWVGALQEKTSELAPDGYIACILRLALETMRVLSQEAGQTNLPL